MAQVVPATAVLGPGLTGLTIGLRVLNLDGTTYAAFSTTSVAETAVAGTYRKAGGVVVPDAGGYLVWGVSGTDYAEATVEPVPLTSTQAGYLDAAVSSRLATGADGDTGETLSDQLDTAQAVLDAIDTSDITYVSSQQAGALSMIRGATYSTTLTGLTISADWATMALRCKRKANVADGKDEITIVVTNGGDAGDGLTILGGAAVAEPITNADASLTVNQGAGTVAIWVSDEATNYLGVTANGIWHLREVDDDEDTTQIAAGTFNLALV